MQQRTELRRGTDETSDLFVWLGFFLISWEVSIYVLTNANWKKKKKETWVIEAHALEHESWVPKGKLSQFFGEYTQALSSCRWWEGAFPPVLQQGIQSISQMPFVLLAFSGTIQPAFPIIKLAVF